MSKMNRPEILSKKEFKEICQGKDVHIIGCTNLKSGDKHKENGLYIGGEYYRKVKKTKFNRIAGYIDVGEKQDSGDDYVRYVKFNPLFVIIPLILAVLIALILYINAGNKIRPIGEILDLENIQYNSCYLICFQLILRNLFLLHLLHLFLLLLHKK